MTATLRTCARCGAREPDWWSRNNVDCYHWWREHGGTEGFTRQRTIRARCREQWERVHFAATEEDGDD